jgi:transcriptional regulator with XRE-family HTH domain
MPQIELATKLGVGQAAVSKFERQSDMLISTLASYLTALGASARLSITINGQTVEEDLTTSEGEA